MFVSQILEEVLEILGTTNEEKAFRKITQAVQTLMESGHWSQSTAEVDICTGWDGYSVTLPRGVDTPLAVNVDGSPVYFRNRLFQYHVNKGGMYNPVSWAWDDRGFTATAMEILQPSQLVAIAELENDAGKTLRVLGTNGNNIALRSQLPNGVAVDGILVPIHSQNDFPLGTILPDDATVETRIAKIDPIVNFTTATPHQLDSGEGVNIQNLTGTIPVPLSNGEVLYLGVIDAVTIRLYNDQINARENNFPIQLQSIVGSGTLQIKDSKPTSVVTALEFATAPTLPISTANPVVFPEGQTLPIGLTEKVTYFANLIDPTHLQVFKTFEDAQNNKNPVYLTGSTDPIDVDVRKEILPETKLVFAVQHFYQQGDAVQVFSGGGSLPSPLIENQNYYVNIIDDFTITLHESQADAIASSPTNPINAIPIRNAGSGSNFTVKLLASTFRPGETLQVSAPGLNIPPATGSGAQFQAVVVGSVIDVIVNNQGAGYTSDPTVTFSPPPEPPIGSGQQVITAEGYAIRNTVSNKIEQVVITNPGQGYTSAPAVTFTGGGFTTVATATAVIRTSFVSHFVKVNGGLGYTQPPQVEITGGGGTGATAQAIVNTTVLPLSGITVSGGTATASTGGTAHGYSKDQVVTISGASPSIFNGNKTITSVPTVPTSVTLARLVSTSSVVTATSSTDHNYSTGQKVTISGATQSAYNGEYNIVVINNTQFAYICTGLPTTPATGTIISSVPDPTATTFDFAITSGTPDATTPGQVSTGDVVGLNVITSGTGYLSAPQVAITPSTGVFIEFSSTGTLPSPLVAGTAYRAEAPLSAGQFTIRNADFSKINLLGGGSGTFYTVLSRTFGVDFTDRWLGDFSSLSSGQEIYFGSDFVLPQTDPAISATTPRYLNIFSNKIAKAYDSAPNAIAGGTTGLIEVVSFGVGQTYYGIRYEVEPLPYDNLLAPDSVLYLSDDEIVRFSTSGTLPAPLVAGTDYRVRLFGDNVRVYTTGGTLVPLTTPGIGQLSLDIERVITPQPSTSILLDKALYETGQAVTLRPATGDSLPYPLLSATTYFVRRISENEIELYATKAQATGTGTTGRIEFRTPGNTVESEFFIDAIDESVLVKSVSHIEKPITDGFVSLYAWDYGRSNDMTLIGHYHPNEVNPQYRRIRIGKPCAWVRLLHRVSPPYVTSGYDYIPIEHERAILAAVHAVDLEDKDFADQAARYWGIAFNYLRNQQEHIDGHAMLPPQINNVTYGDGTDPVIF